MLKVNLTVIELQEKLELFSLNLYIIKNLPKCQTTLRLYQPEGSTNLYHRSHAPTYHNNVI